MDGIVNFGAELQSHASVFLVRLNDAQGNMLHHRIFSTKELAKAYIKSQRKIPGQHFRTIERLAVSHAAESLKKHEANSIQEKRT
jgi:hypothetical protein